MHLGVLKKKMQKIVAMLIFVNLNYPTDDTDKNTMETAAEQIFLSALQVRDVVFKKKPLVKTLSIIL